MPGRFLVVGCGSKKDGQGIRESKAKGNCRKTEGRESGGF